MSPKLNLPIQTNTLSLVETCSCDSSSKPCMHSTCDEHCDTGLKVEDFKDDFTEIQVYKWKKVDKKVQKVVSVLLPDDLITLFDEEVRVLEKHIFKKRQQHAAYNHLKENLKPGEVLLNVDYSENYVNKIQQDKIQGP